MMLQCQDVRGHWESLLVGDTCREGVARGKGFTKAAFAVSAPSKKWRVSTAVKQIVIGANQKPGRTLVKHFDG